METRFLLPLTVATAFHALVFFGVEWQHPNLASPVEKVPPVETQPPPFEVDLNPPVETERDVQAVQAKGEPDQALSEPDVLSAHPPLFEQPLRPEMPPTTTIAHRIPNAPIGVPDGVAGIDWKGVDMFNAGDLENSPRTRSQVAPIYPTAERGAGITGEVLVEFTVDESGRVLNPRVVRSSLAAFEAATLRAVEKWRFEPGRVQGRAVRFRMMVPVKFSLND